jgi:predicted thioesterase
MHPDLPPVYSTPNMIRLMETACFRALVTRSPFRDNDEFSD